MLIGTLMTGQIEHVGGQWVASKFLLVGVPLAPLESALCIADDGGQRRNYSIPLHWKSVLIAYARWISGILFACTAVFSAIIITEEKGTYRWCAVLPALVLLIAFILSLFYLGRLSKRERLRRTILGQITGFYVDPRILSQGMTSNILGKLRRAATSAGLNLSPEYWNAHIPDSSVIGLLFALARYESQASSSPPWARIAEDMWTIIEKEYLAHPTV